MHQYLHKTVCILFATLLTVLHCNNYYCCCMYVQLFNQIFSSKPLKKIGFFFTFTLTFNVTVETMLIVALPVPTSAPPRLKTTQLDDVWEGVARSQSNTHTRVNIYFHTSVSPLTRPGPFTFQCSFLPQTREHSLRHAIARKTHAGWCSTSCYCNKTRVLGDKSRKQTWTCGQMGCKYTQ